MMLIELFQKCLLKFSDIPLFYVQSQAVPLSKPFLTNLYYFSIRPQEFVLFIDTNFSESTDILLTGPKSCALIHVCDVGNIVGFFFGILSPPGPDEAQ